LLKLHMLHHQDSELPNILRCCCRHKAAAVQLGHTAYAVEFLQCYCQQHAVLIRRAVLR
jgi:hypothetical protein